MRIEVESPEQLGYAEIRHNLAEGSVSDTCLADYGIDADVGRIVLPYGEHLGRKRLRELIAGAAPGRTGDDDVTVADLTGVGIQDAAIAAFVVRAAAQAG